MEDGTMPKITTFLIYDDQAEEAAKFYVSVFKNSRIGTSLATAKPDRGPRAA